MLALVQAQAPPVPAPVKITLSVNGQNADYADTKVTNKRTGEVLTKADVGSLAIQDGIGLVDLSEFKQGYAFPSTFPVYSGDPLEIVACNIHTDCTQTIIVSDTPLTVSFSITTGDVYVCPDGSLVSDISLCPEEEEEPEPEPVVEPETKVSSNADETLVSVEVNYGQEIDIEVVNNKLAKLIDSVIDFDGDEYDVSEKVYFEGIIQTSLDDEDFGLAPYLVVEEGAIEYRYVFDDEITLEDISEDEELEIVFLGKEIRIIKASESEVTIRTGDYEFLAENESIVVDGKVIEIKTIGENSVLVDVAGTQQIVNLDSSKEINRIHITIEDILYKDYGESYVELIIGTSADKKVQDGDDFELFIEDDEEYRWVINLPSYIGITNQEAYKGIDEDDDFKAITVGESLALPNDYLFIGFSKVTSSDVVDLEFKVKDDYLYVKGNLDDSFAFGSDEFRKLYINSEGIYDDDKELITSDKVRIGDSDTYLELLEGMIQLQDLTIRLLMDDVFYDGVSFKDKDGNYLDYSGIIFKDAENSVEDKEGFKVSVPEERPEATITIGAEVEVITPTTTIPVEPTTTTIPPVTTTTIPVTPPPVIIEKIICEDGTEVSEASECPIVEPEDNLKTILITLIATIIGLFAWGKGFAGLIKYYLRLADETKDKELAKKYRARAEKMAKTVVTNFLAGKYKKK